jgi:hypothetical protein
VMRKVRDLGLSFDPIAFGNPLQLQFGLLAGADIFDNTHEQFDCRRRFPGFCVTSIDPDEVAV